MKNPIRIETLNLTKSFDGITAVDHMNLEILPGEIMGFLGPNGAGKTTAIRMICGLLKPDEGQILFNGLTLNQFPDGKSLLGVCPQDNVHWERLTCMEQMVFTGEMYNLGRTLAKSRSHTLLEQLGLTPQSGKQARRLSGGMKRRLNIALALVHDPAVLILDEPEAGLDPQSRLLMREFIRNLSGSRTIILTTHNMDEADRLSDRVAIIDQGRILKTDTPQNLKRSGGTSGTLQITLDSDPDIALLNNIRELSPIAGDIAYHSGQLIIKSSDPLRLMPRLLEILNNAGFHASEVQVRENTLEDVFILLTGKALRS